MFVSAYRKLDVLIVPSGIETNIIMIVIFPLIVLIVPSGIETMGEVAPVQAKTLY